MPLAHACLSLLLSASFADIIDMLTFDCLFSILSHMPLPYSRTPFAWLLWAVSHALIQFDIFMQYFSPISLLFCCIDAFSFREGRFSIIPLQYLRRITCPAAWVNYKRWRCWFPLSLLFYAHSCHCAFLIWATFTVRFWHVTGQILGHSRPERLPHQPPPSARSSYYFPISSLKWSMIPWTFKWQQPKLHEIHAMMSILRMVLRGHVEG